MMETMKSVIVKLENEEKKESPSLAKVKEERLNKMANSNNRRLDFEMIIERPISENISSQYIDSRKHFSVSSFTKKQ